MSPLVHNNCMCGLSMCCKKQIHSRHTILSVPSGVSSLHKSHHFFHTTCNIQSISKTSNGLVNLLLYFSPHIFSTHLQHLSLSNPLLQVTPQLHPPSHLPHPIHLPSSQIPSPSPPSPTYLAVKGHLLQSCCSKEGVAPSTSRPDRSTSE